MPTGTYSTSTSPVCLLIEHGNCLEAVCPQSTDTLPPLYPDSQTANTPVCLHIPVTVPVEQLLHIHSTVGGADDVHRAAAAEGSSGLIREQHDGRGWWGTLGYD